MKSLQIKYWVGWIKSSLTIFEIGNLWYNKVQIAEREKCELVVFQIPTDDKHRYNEAVSEIERLLQKKFGTDSLKEELNPKLQTFNEVFLKVFLKEK